MNYGEKMKIQVVYHNKALIWFNKDTMKASFDKINAFGKSKITGEKEGFLWPLGSQYDKCTLLVDTDLLQWKGN